MKILLHICVAVGCFYAIQAGAQSGKSNRADKLFNRFAYKKASLLYEDILAEKQDTLNATKKLAECYRKMGDTEKTEEYYGQLLAYNNYAPEPIELLYYAEALKSNEKYDAANDWYKKYETLDTTGDIRAKKHLEAWEYAKKLKTGKNKYEISPVSFNSPENDFSPSFYGDKLLFTSSRKEDRIVKRVHSWDDRPFLDLFVFENQEVKWLNLLHDKKINSSVHDGPGVMNEGGDVIYFTRNNYYKGRIQKDGKGISKLKIYYRVHDGEKWGEIKEMPFNHEKYSVAHPALNRKGNLIIFSSDMSGSLGGTDLYRSGFFNGKWTEPENLGNTVNTAGNEMFPFLDENGDLIFASDGHVGLGGLDIFISKSVNNVFESPVNIGAPINSSKDDFGFIMRMGSDNRKEGYFSSNRPGGEGGDDIYYWKEAAIMYLKGIVKDKITGLPIPQSKVVLESTQGEKIIIISDENGKFETVVERGETYSLKVSHSWYFPYEMSISTNTDEPIVEAIAPLDVLFMLYTLISDRTTRKPLNEVKYIVIDLDLEKELIIGTTLLSGDFRLGLPGKAIGDSLILSLSIHKYGYLGKTIRFGIKLEKPGEIDLYKFLEGKTDLPHIEIGMDIGKLLDINPIYFDLDKSNIRPDATIELDKIVEAMKENPTLEIELGAHTDSRGSDAYNLGLSDRRAKSSADYISSRGINHARINGKGYGETQLINRCKNNVKCNEADHQINRRTEFRIVKI